MRYLGMAGYYRRFIEKFAEIASPFYRLLKKDVSFIFLLIFEFCGINFSIKWQNDYFNKLKAGKIRQKEAKIK